MINNSPMGSLRIFATLYFRKNKNAVGCWGGGGVLVFPRKATQNGILIFVKLLISLERNSPRSGHHRIPESL